MEEISKVDVEFLDDFFDDELTEENLQELDKKLKNLRFKEYYEKRLNQKYNISASKQFFAYLPMILLIGLTIIGIYLILER